MIADILPPLLLRSLHAVRRKLFRRGSTGLNGLDLKLLAVIKPVKGGYFVELGANDGIRQSNTWLLQKNYGWTGLLIEPSPIRYRECVANRAFARAPHVRCAACVPFDFPARFVEIEDSDLMSVAKGLDVADEVAISHAELGKQYLEDQRFRFIYGSLARTLTSLLDEVNAPALFDLLSLDVEGNEFAVLRGLDLSRYRPRWILVEVRDLQISSFLQDAGYEQYACLSANNDYSDLLFRLRDEGLDVGVPVPETAR